MNPSILLFVLACLQLSMCADSSLICPHENWLGFIRAKNQTWCMKLFPGIISQATAQTQCEKLGAALSGIDNKDELDLFKIYTGMMAADLGLSEGLSIWVGGKRKENCLGSLSTKANCDISGKSFAFTDKSNNSFAFPSKWATGEPDNNFDRWTQERENCLVLTNDLKDAKFRDTACDTRQGLKERGNKGVYGYLCGMKAIDASKKQKQVLVTDRKPTKAPPTVCPVTKKV
ncbi:unnamed protein product [Caenorhabditis auriculariae]|uniref:C-type lectin domain-containing protein n=1 Tax=Caenorhabditis auriculariae TaxID=2777116 RepID=A0A8S1HHX9_9PELO|nr:unnamed protein product [Caenorhabditis auriculariae]